MAYGYTSYTSRGATGGGETYIQRMKRIQSSTASPDSPATSAAPASQTTQATAANGGITAATPVTGDGKIPPPSSTPPPPAPPAPVTGPDWRPPDNAQQVAASTAYSMPSSADPFQGNGFWTGSQWVPKDHPLAQQGGTLTQAPGMTQAGATATPTAAPAFDAQNAPLVNPTSYGMNPAALNGGEAVPGQPGMVFMHNGHGWVIAPSGASAAGGGAAATPAAPLFNVKTPEVGIPTNPAAQLPASYAGTQYTQYVAPDHDAQNQQQLDLVSKLLTNAQTQSPEVIEQMKQKQMEEQLSFQKQYADQASEDYQSRGFSGAGGQNDAAKRSSQDALMSAILGKNRDIEIGAATQNRTDELNALNASEGILGGQVGRGSEVYNNILKGQTAQGADDQQVSQDAITRALSQYGADLQGAQFNLGQQQANRDDYTTQQQLALQRELGVGGLDADAKRLSEQGRQFDQSNALNILQYLEGQRQSNNSLGYNYSALNANQNNTMMSYIMNMLGGK